jgi:hypothetical protein
MSAKLYHQASAGETETKNFRKKLYVSESPASWAVGFNYWLGRPLIRGSG